MSDMSSQRFAIFHQMLLFQGYTRCLLTLLTPVINILIIIKKRVTGLLPPSLHPYNRKLTKLTADALLSLSVMRY